MAKEETDFFYIRVLKNYSDKLKDLENHPEFSINEFTRCDLNKEKLDVEALFKFIEENGTESGVDIGILEYDDKRKLLCHALKSYLQDLNLLIEAIRKKLGIEDLDFQLTNKEISFTEKKLKRLCTTSNVP